MSINQTLMIERIHEMIIEMMSQTNRYDYERIADQFSKSIQSNFKFNEENNVLDIHDIVSTYQRKLAKTNSGYFRYSDEIRDFYCFELLCTNNLNLNQIKIKIEMKSYNNQSSFIFSLTHELNDIFHSVSEINFNSETYIQRDFHNYLVDNLNYNQLSLKSVFDAITMIYDLVITEK